jgi:hypothetical protein
MNADEPNFNLRICASGQMEKLAHLAIYNAFDERVAKGYHSLTASLPKGLYRVIVEINEKVIEKHLRVDRDIDEIISIPATSSSIAMKGFESSHEYYSDNAEKWSMASTTTFNFESEKRSGSLFIFFRYPDRDIWRKNQHKESLGRNFCILNNKRELFTQMSSGVVQEDFDMGWLAFHARVPCGMYYLHYVGVPESKDSPAREIPISVFTNWQTQAFLTFKDRPLFSTLRISIERPEKGFKKDDDDNYMLEGVLQKFANGIYYLPEAELINLAYKKWENPMLAILCAYIYLASDQRRNDDFFKDVVDKLGDNILNTAAPDIVALKMIKALHFNEPLQKMTLTEPPMLLAGLQSILNASTKNPFLIKKESFAEDVLDKLYTDSVWTNYCPGPVRGQKTKSRAVETPAAVKYPKVSWTENTILDILETKSGMNMEIPDIAKRLNLTPNIVMKSMSNLTKGKKDAKSAINIINVKLQNYKASGMGDAT